MDKMNQSNAKTLPLKSYEKHSGTLPEVVRCRCKAPVIKLDEDGVHIHITVRNRQQIGFLVRIMKLATEVFIKN